MSQTLAFLITVIVEITVAWTAITVFRSRYPEKKSRVLIAVLAVNLISHPLAWALFQKGIPFLALESAVTGFEAIALRFCLKIPFRACLGLGVLMNALSAGVGLLWRT